VTDQCDGRLTVKVKLRLQICPACSKDWGPAYLTRQFVLVKILVSRDSLITKCKKQLANKKVVTSTVSERLCYFFLSRINVKAAYFSYESPRKEFTAIV